ncbi:MAG: hypothetical protein KIS92_22695 [Planctomycetota bacterium]|nr:hypothetical protein [Planctomycetota bacterium]
MKLRCAACNNDLNIPDHLGGKNIKCPICGQQFSVPGASAPRAAAPVKRASDELHLTALNDKGPAEDGPAKRDFCPHCGAKWHAGDTSCRKCSFNVALNRRLNAAASRKRVSIPLDFTKVFLIVCAAGAVYGVYYLYNNWTEIERKTKDAYDNASRAPVTTDSERPLEQKPRAQPAAADPLAKTEAGGPVADPAAAAQFNALPVDERVALALADLRVSETFSRGRARAVELARVPEAVPLLAKALDDSWANGSKETYEFRFALATALAAQKSAALAPTFAACLTVKGMDPSRSQPMIALAASALKGLGDAAQPAVEMAFKEGDDDARIGILRACERNEWTFAVGLLKPMLVSKNVFLRRAALDALSGKLADASLAPNLAEALNDPDACAAMSASRALAVLAKDAGETVLAKLEAQPKLGLARLGLYARAVMPLGDASVNEGLAARVREWAGGPLPAAERMLLLPSDVERGQQVMRFAAGDRMEPPAAQFYAALLLSDPFKLVRRRASWALFGSRDAAVAEALAFACLDEDLQTAVHAADAPDPKAASPAAKAVWTAGLTEAGHRRLCCAGALHRSGAAEGTKALREAAAYEGGLPLDRALALRFLGQDMTGAEKALAERLKGAYGGDPQVQRFLNSALARAGDPKAVAALNANLRAADSEPNREAALHEVMIHGDPAVVPVLLDALRSGTVSGSLAPMFAQTLERMPSPEVMGALIAAFPSANDQTMEWIALAVARYGEPARKALDAPLKSNHARERATALTALVALGGRDALLQAAKALKDEKEPLAVNAANQALARATGYPAGLHAGEWDVLISGAKADLGGTWVKIGEGADVIQYSVPEALAEGYQGAPWPGGVQFGVHRENGNLAAIVADLRASLRDGKAVRSGRPGRVIALEAQYGASEFSGVVWADGGRVFGLFAASYLEGETRVHVRADFSCKEALWPYNQALLEKLMTSVELHKPKR